MRVLFIASARMASFGGIQSFLSDLSSALAAEGVHTSTASYECVFPSFERARKWFARYVADPSASTVGVRQWIRSLIAEHRPDRIHSHNSHIPNSPAIANVIEEEAERAGIPHLLTIHSVTASTRCNDTHY